MNVILAFDLMERKLFEISLPDDFDHEHTYCELWVFEEFISLWATNCPNYTLEIWVMTASNFVAIYDYIVLCNMG